MSERDSQICQIYKENDGVSVRDISDKYDISYQRVHQILQDNDIEASSGYSKQFNKDQIKKQIKKFYQNEGYVPTSKDWEDSNYEPSVGTIYNRYGSWTEALLDANMPKNNIGKKKKYSRSNLIESLTYAHEEVSGNLTQTSYQKVAKGDDTLPHYQTFIKRFGSWSSAVSAMYQERS